MFGFGEVVKPTTVDGVLDVFRTAITDLIGVADQNLAIAEKEQQIAQEALERSKAANAEASRANTIAKQMQAVFTVKE